MAYIDLDVLFKAIPVKVPDIKTMK